MIQFVRERVLTKKTAKWVLGVTAVVVPGTVAALNAPKLFKKTPAVAVTPAETPPVVAPAAPATPVSATPAPPTAPRTDPFAGSQLTTTLRAQDPAAAPPPSVTPAATPPLAARYDEQVMLAAGEAQASDDGSAYDELAAESAEPGRLEGSAPELLDDANLQPPPRTGSSKPLASRRVPPLANRAETRTAEIDDYGASGDEGLKRPADSAEGSSRAGDVLVPRARPPVSQYDQAAVEPVDEGITSAPAASQGAAGNGRPGESRLEGRQSPHIAIEKAAPEEIQVGREAIFEIFVRNDSKVEAQDVVVEDDVPQGTRFISSEPAAKTDRNGRLSWLLGTLKPGEERLLQMKVMPETEGEIGSVARVSFAAAASVRTVCTRPKLVLDAQAPRTVLIGDRLQVAIKTNNPGTGAASGVLLEASLPTQFEHQAGSDLEYEVGDLKPSQAKDMELSLKAVRPGRTTLVLVAHAEANLKCEQRLDVEVLAPSLVVGFSGSKKRYLERESNLVLTISNPGTAAATDVELVATLPAGMKFVKADNYGEYNSAQRTVHWSLESLPPGEIGEVTITVVPSAAGEVTLAAQATAARDLVDKQEFPISIEGIAAILFEVVDLADPVDVNGETIYEVRVVNQGSKASTNLRLTIDLPEGLLALDAEGPARHSITDAQVTFEPVAQLAAKAETLYRVRVKATGAGDHRIAAQLSTDEMRRPVTKEESTRVVGEEE